MKKIFTLLFAITLFASTAIAQSSCDDIIDADVVSSGRINLTFTDATVRDAFLANEGGAITASPGGMGTLENWSARAEKLRILGLSGLMEGPFTGTIVFTNFTCTFDLGSLPVSLASFTGKKMEKSIRLEWKTESELNNDYFAVERSMDGRNFEQLTKVSGKGNSTERVVYAFEDKNPESATNYYRLRQVDYDGTESFSDIVSVKFKANRLDLNLYPTLVREEVNLDLTNYENENVLINILNSTGQIVLSKEVNSSEIVTLSLGNLNLSEGMYYARCQSLGQITIGKFLILK